MKQHELAQPVHAVVMRDFEALAYSIALLPISKELSVLFQIQTDNLVSVFFSLCLSVFYFYRLVTDVPALYSLL